jgi:hypothetical protein
LIAKAQLAELFRLYSDFHGAIDPTEPAVLKAEAEFFALLHTLHNTHATDISFNDFRRHAIRECKLFLRNN